MLTFIFLGAGVIIAAILAARLARRLFGAEWSRLPAVAASAIAGLSAGFVLSAIGAVVALSIGESF